jgi:lysophospholipase L1-like esterase
MALSAGLVSLDTAYRADSLPSERDAIESVNDRTDKIYHQQNAGALTIAQVISSVSIRKREIMLVLASTAAAVVVLELVARMLFPAPLPWLYPQVSYRADPIVGFALVPGQHAYTTDQPVVINADGFRGELVSHSRTSGMQRLLFLGDSIGFGYGVAEDHVTAHVVTALLNQRGQPTEFINTSVPAYNTEQEVATLKRSGIAYQPDWVIVQVCWNDIADKSKVTVNAHGWLVSAATTATEREAPVGFWESPRGYDIRNRVKRFRLLYVASQGVSALRALTSPPPESRMREEVLLGKQTDRTVQGWKRLGAALHELHDLAQQHRFRVLLVAYPIPYALERSFPHSSYPTTLAQLARHEGFPLIDLNESYRSAYRGHTSLFIPYDGDHPNAQGHRLAAEQIARFMLEQPHSLQAPGQ